MELMRHFAESYPDGICETVVSRVKWQEKSLSVKKNN